MAEALLANIDWNSVF